MSELVNLPEKFTKYHHELIPSSVNELVPFTKVRHTFSDTYFNKDFESLEFKEKLQVVCDIYRQTLIPNYKAKPDEEMDTLSGDCHTASKHSIGLLQELGVGHSHDYVLSNRRPFDPPEKQSGKHAYVVLKDDFDEEWIMDPAPWMGYGYGTVSRVSDQDSVYQSYSRLTNEEHSLLNYMRRERAEMAVVSDAEAEHILDLLSSQLDNSKLHSFLGETFAVLAQRVSEDKRHLFCNLALTLDPYRGFSEYLLRYADEDLVLMHKHARTQLVKYTDKQCEIWAGEINLLTKQPGNEQRILQLSSWMKNEKQFSRVEKPNMVDLEGVQLPIEAINPRVCAEYNLQTVLIKPSAYFQGVESKIEQAFSGFEIIDQYEANIGELDIDGVPAMSYSHSLGSEYARSYSGHNKVLLVRGDSQELEAIKNEIRKECGRSRYGNTYKWFDGKDIEWHPYYMNYVHTTDSPHEAALHYHVRAPESSPMTRWMYPNPRLRSN